MSVQIETRVVIIGSDVADAKNQLIQLFGVALGRVAIVDESDKAPIVVTLNESGSVLPPAVNQGAAQVEPPKRIRRTKAEIEAAKAGAAIESAPQPEPKPTASVNGAAAEPAAEDDLDLLSGGNGAAAETTEDPLADEPAKPTAKTAKPITKDDMMAKGHEIVNKAGMQKLTEILKKHGLTRVAAIPEHAYPAVMADFEEALA